MSNRRIEAVYEHGAFRPVVPLAPPPREGQHVQLIVEPSSEAQAYLDLAMRVLEGLSDEDMGAIETMAQRRTGFFEPDDPSGDDAS